MVSANSAARSSWWWWCAVQDTRLTVTSTLIGRSLAACGSR
jgi:hypothetical protein